jgi:hypothetical protein
MADHAFGSNVPYALPRLSVLAIGKSPQPTRHACDKRKAFAQGSPCDEAIQLPLTPKAGLLRGACHRARIRASARGHRRAG